MGKISIRFTDEQEMLLKKQAKQAGKDMSAYVRSLLFPENKNLQAANEKVIADNVNQATAEIKKTVEIKFNEMAQMLNDVRQSAYQNNDDIVFGSMLLQQVICQKIIYDKSFAAGYHQPTAAAKNYAQEILDAAYTEANKAFDQQQQQDERK